MMHRDRFQILFLAAACIANAGPRAPLGKASAFVARMAAGEAAGKVFEMPVDSAETRTVDLDAAEADEKGFSISGRVRGAANSDFILHGGASDLSGWMALRDRDAAWLYATDGQGILWSERVPVSRIFPVCDLPDGPAPAGAPFPEPPPPPAPALASASDSLSPFPVFIRPYGGTSLRKLQSRPGASKVIYVDVTRIMNGETPIGWTREQMWQIWQGFTSGLSMFDVNVTTDSNVYKAAGLRNSGRAIMFDQTGTSNSPVDGFGSSRYSTIYRKSSAMYNAGTLIHEVGHLLGLSHDGGPGAEYFSGFSAYQWCPIMGSHATALKWPNILWQWSKGQYAGATETQDDLQLINRHLDYLEDDIPGSVPLRLDGDSVPVVRNWGRIGRSDDSDSFTFQIGSSGGRAKLKIDRIEYAGGSMLDVDATLRDASGRIVARKNKIGARSAELDTALPAGRYTLTIKGGAEGTPANGFSNYSSLGYYGIQGRIAGAAGPAVALSGRPEGGEGFTTVGQGGKLALRFPPGAAVSDIALHSATGARVFASRERVEAIDTAPLRAGIYVLSARLDGRTRALRVAVP